MTAHEDKETPVVSADNGSADSAGSADSGGVRAAAKAPAITREALAAAGLAVLRREGLDALSMRKVAAELGVRAASLYYHVQDKEQLLDLIADSVVWDARKLATAGDWEQCLREAAHAYYRHLHANRDAARLMAGRRTPGPNLLYVLDVMIGRLHAAGFSDEVAARATLTISTYVQGYVLQEQVPKAPRREPDAASELSESCRTASAKQHRNIMSLLTVVKAGDTGAQFSFGVERLIDGLRAQLPGDPES
ncbi:TetR/AcrR family transcriptional regulator C-terminal domain-containing protein [Catenulispora sp. NL8]|uniref:TetR/AcrR family transcriptional regulator C-terminal domain-containing protein n=1 Tax=Catenulispora pinistramenti TaxID=2705254 RepID=A0ABS5L2U8_9ACTN|nr:TetR/AcrR family transcriptional regulator [Catenulispora pinistramenti]MBS2552494.1 TetR/AcrR family transcriptional regulator C-terminal domain-containing protein [Catenulispora pinistramenti]